MPVVVPGPKKLRERLGDVAAEPDRRPPPGLRESVLDPQTPEERHERDRLIFQARASDLSWPRIAREFHMSEPGARQAARRYRQRERMDVLDREHAEDLVHETLGGYEAKLEQLAALGQNAQGSVRLGAIREALGIYERRSRLLAELGVLPEDLGQFRLQRDVVATAHKIVGVIEGHAGLDRETRESLMLEVLRAVSPGAAGELEAPEDADGEDGELVSDAEVVA